MFEASYDAWGRQTVVLNDIDLERGYCGHVMLPFDNLIDMGGRVYDSAVGRFLSCDNYVQEPNNSQNFNRYSYCLNNPLRYVDPTGEFAWFVPVIAGAIIGGYIGASLESKTFNFTKWDSGAWKGAIAGAIVGATIGYSISAAYGLPGTNLLTSHAVPRIPGIVSSILNSGTTNICINTITNNGWDAAWKSGVTGLITGAWSSTGGLGIVKGVGKTRTGKLIGKLGYQIVGTVAESIGENWVENRNMFSKIIIGLGPLNFTIGKGYPLLNWRDNITNIATYLGGGAYTLLGGGKIGWNSNDLTITFTVGDKWHSRTIGWKYFPQYLLHGINAVISDNFETTNLDKFTNIPNFYETIPYCNYWWPTN